MKIKKGIWVVIVLVVALLVSSLLCGVVVYTDRAFICQNTGSIKGYRQWQWGSSSGQWYRQSELEKFMKDKYPDRLEYDWSSYAGTGKNIFGTKTYRSHEHPRNRMFAPNTFFGLLNDHVKGLDDQGRLELYEFFKTQDEKAIQAKLEQLVDEL
ncbi:MAG: hypothetical protein JEZ07_19225 [Phycisphaerae bacterium]|nr:hypothetical protein [Phycisphaerae bacterium]